eukprot:6703308-Prymnesium_polylepis.1
MLVVLSRWAKMRTGGAEVASRGTSRYLHASRNLSSWRWLSWFQADRKRQQEKRFQQQLLQAEHASREMEPAISGLRQRWEETSMHILVSAKFRGATLSETEIKTELARLGEAFDNFITSLRLAEVWQRDMLPQQSIMSAHSRARDSLLLCVHQLKLNDSEVLEMFDKLGLRLPEVGEATLWFKPADTSELEGDLVQRDYSTNVIKVLKGVDVFDRDCVLNPEVPQYIQALTTPYDLAMMYWEIVECVRKLALIALPLLFQPPGTIPQISFGILLATFFLLLYNNLKPYNAWQNDILQELCQLNIFLTLLIALVHIVVVAPEVSEKERDTGHTGSDARGLVLILLTVLTLLLAVLLAYFEADRKKLNNLLRELVAMLPCATGSSLSFLPCFGREDEGESADREAATDAPDREEAMSQKVHSAKDMLPDQTKAMARALDSTVAVKVRRRIRRKWEPLLAGRGLQWEDVEPALELVTNYEDLQQAAEDPEAFLEGLAT